MKELALNTTYEQKRNPYFLALEADKLCEMDSNDAICLIMEVITKCFFDLNYADIGGADKAVLGAAILEELRPIFAQCTTDEFKLLCANGVRREYGEFIGSPSVALIHQWVKGFLKSEARQNAKKEAQAAHQESLKPIMTPEQAEQEWKETLQKQFKMFKETGTLHIEFPVFMFSQFEKLGMIKLTIAEKKKIYEEATGVVKRRMERDAKEAVKIIDRNEAKNFLFRMESNQLLSTDQMKIKQEAMALSIRRYYAGITELKFPEK